MNTEHLLRRIFAEPSWKRYEDQLHDEWDGVIAAMRALGAPAKLESMGGNLYGIQVVGEDPDDYVHLWAGAEDSFDNGNAFINAMDRTECTHVGGCHYVEDERGDFTFSEPVSIELFGDPMDDHDMAATLVDAWRQLRTAPTDYGSN